MANYWSPMWLYCDVCFINSERYLSFFCNFVWSTYNIFIFFVMKDLKQFQFIAPQRNIVASTVL